MELDRFTAKECKALFKEGKVLDLNADNTLRVQTGEDIHESIPIHYHCNPNWIDKSHPHSAATMLRAFAVDDEVVVLFEESSPKFVVGFKDGNLRLCTMLIVLFKQNEETDWWYWDLTQEVGYHQNPKIHKPSTPELVRKYYKCEGGPLDPPTLYYNIETPVFGLISFSGAVDDCVFDFDIGQCCDDPESPSDSQSWVCQGPCIGSFGNPTASCPGSYPFCDWCCGSFWYLSVGSGKTTRSQRECYGETWKASIGLDIGTVNDNLRAGKGGGGSRGREGYAEDTRRYDGQCLCSYGTHVHHEICTCVSGDPCCQATEEQCNSAGGVHGGKYDTLLGNSDDEAVEWSYLFSTGSSQIVFGGGWTEHYFHGNNTWQDGYWGSLPWGPCMSGGDLWYCRNLVCPGYSEGFQGASDSDPWSEYELTETSYGLDGSFATYKDAGSFAVLLSKLSLSVSSLDDDGAKSCSLDSVTVAVLRIMYGGSVQEVELASAEYDISGSSFWSDRDDIHIKPTCWNENANLPREIYLRAFHWYTIDSDDYILVAFKLGGEFFAYLLSRLGQATSFSSQRLYNFETWVNQNSLQDHYEYIH